MSKTNQEFLAQVSRFLTFIPQEYIEALLTLQSKLDGKEIKWVVNGDLAERLRLVKVDPDCIEIVASKDGVEKIFENLKEFNPQPVKFQTQQLTRNAVIAGKEFPVFHRSYYFDFKIKTVTIKVHGDLQFKVDNWEWGEVFDFNPEYVYVTGKKIAVTPLTIQYEFYQMLNWVDRAEKINQITKPLRQNS